MRPSRLIGFWRAMKAIGELEFGPGDDTEVDLGPEDLLDAVAPNLPDVGLSDFRWMIDVGGMREIINIAQEGDDPDMAMLSILAHTDFSNQDDE